MIHSRDDEVILQFGLHKPASRVLVNTVSAGGAVGLTTGLMPSMTLGAGGIGGSITGDNITVYHMFNIKRLAYEIKDPPPIVFQPVEKRGGGLSPQDIEQIVQAAVSEALKVR